MRLVRVTRSSYNTKAKERNINHEPYIYNVVLDSGFSYDIPLILSWVVLYVMMLFESNSLLIICAITVVLTLLSWFTDNHLTYYLSLMCLLCSYLHFRYRSHDNSKYSLL